MATTETRPQVCERSRANAAALPAEDGLRQVRGSYVTAVAVQRPRHIPAVERSLLDEARLMGEAAYYGWAAGKDAIEGPSIDLAVAAARCWGNCATEMLPVQDAGDSWIFTAAFLDLETGYTRMRQFRQSKASRIAGRMDEERKADIRFQVGQSKAERNVILKALPSWLIDKALAAAKEGVKAKVERFVADKGLPAATDIILRALAKCGVKEPQVLAKCGVAARRGIQVEDLVILRGDLHAIESGQERADVLFPAAEAATPAEAPKADGAAPPPAEAPAPKKGRKGEFPRRLATPPQREDAEALCARLGLDAAAEGLAATTTEAEAEALLTRLRDRCRGEGLFPEDEAPAI